MKKNKFNYLTILALLFINSAFVSCSSEEQTDILTIKELKTNGTLIFDNINKQMSLKNNSTNTNETELDIEFSFLSKQEIPIFDNNLELANYLENNLDKINGVFKFIINDEVIYESITTAGIEKIVSVNNNQNNKAGPCSYEGIRQCTRDSIDGMGTISKLLCISSGFSCVAEEFANCAWTNCGGPQI